MLYKTLYSKIKVLPIRIKCISVLDRAALLERTRRRCKDNIKINLEEIGYDGVK
jgi:hypothetical protein